MFDSLADQVRKDQHQQTTPTERIIEGVVIAVLSVLLFAGLYFSIRLAG